MNQSQELLKLVNGQVEYTPAINVVLGQGSASLLKICKALQPVIKEVYDWDMPVKLVDAFVILAVTTLTPDRMNEKYEGIGHRRFGEGRTRSYFIECNGSRAAVHIDNRGSSIELVKPATEQDVINVYSDLMRVTNPSAKNFIKLKK